MLIGATHWNRKSPPLITDAQAAEYIRSDDERGELRTFGPDGPNESDKKVSHIRELLTSDDKPKLARRKILVDARGLCEARGWRVLNMHLPDVRSSLQPCWTIELSLHFS